MTKANVLQIGFSLFLLGAVTYFAFFLFGFNDFKAGIASEIFIALILFGWTLSYFFRVITGKMTFMEQRKRYRQKYEQITDKELQEQLDLMTNDERIKLVDDLTAKTNDS